MDSAKTNKGIYFKTTRNSIILRAMSGKSEALNELASLYRLPILNFIRKHGFTEDDAEDLVQNTLMRVLQPMFLKSKVDLSKGKFRSFLLGVTKNIMREEWKKKNKSKFEELDESVAAPLHEKEFDRDWCDQLYELAMEALRKKDDLAHKIISMKTLGKPYTEIEKKTGLKQTDIANKIRKAKNILAEEIENLVHEYTTSGQDYITELKFIRTTLSLKKNA